MNINYREKYFLYLNKLKIRVLSNKYFFLNHKRKIKNDKVIFDLKKYD